MVCVTTGVLLLPVGFGRLPAAFACSCFGDDTYEDQLARADVVFDGVPTDRSATQPPGVEPITWRFDVSNVVKGAAADPQDVGTPAHSGVCGMEFDLGRPYRILARREGAELTTHSCSGNRFLTGYRLAAADGGVFAFGSSGFHGSAGGLPLNAPVVGITSTPSGAGYWLVAADGGVFAYGDARFFGSAGGHRLNARVVGITSTPTGGGYWLTAADGGVFAYGDARFFGSTGGLRLNAPVVGIAGTGSGRGYWLLGADGGVFAYGDATFQGRTAYIDTGVPGQPSLATGITASHSGTGYWITDHFGGIGGFGDTSPVETNQVPTQLGVVGITRTASSAGIAITTWAGHVNTYGGSWFGDLGGRSLNAPVVGLSA
jgi:hypothetical protein